jgi:Cu(I)/Ag(I) efflux system protein CusF
MKRFVAVLILLLFATAANAQMGGGGGGGRRGGSGGQRTPPASTESSTTSSKPNAAPKPTSKIQIVGVVTAIDPAADRVTIAYEETDALNLPAGTRPFVASKDELLKGVTVGEKVRFSLESQQISSLQPFKVEEPE